MIVKEIINWWWRSCAGFRGRIIASSLLGIIRVAFTLAFIWVSRTLVDVAVSPHSDVSSIVSLSCILASLLLAEILLSLIMQHIMGKTETQLTNRLRIRLLSHVLNSRWVDRQDIHSGDLLSRLTEDVRKVGEVSVQRIPGVVMMIIQFLGAFAFLCVLSWKLALCLVGITPFFIFLSKAYIRRTRILTSRIRNDEGRIQVEMQEGIRHQMVMQTLEATPRVEEEVQTTQSSLLDTVLQRLKFNVYSRAMIRLGFAACFLTAFIWSVWHLHTGAITFGTMTAFLQLVARLQNPVANIAQQIPVMVQTITSVERLMDIEHLTREECGEPLLLPSPLGIRFEEVDFSYPGADARLGCTAPPRYGEAAPPPRDSGQVPRGRGTSYRGTSYRGERMIFRGFSYDFKPGSRTVLMGPTGVGKSTLTKMILGLLNPSKGNISFYGPALEETPVTPATRCNIAYVPQGNSLLQGTIRENLLLVSPSSSEEELREVLSIADAEFVFSLPEGLDTPCREGASGLSEGQAQRIAIARALLRKGSVMIFDEFNSSLDMATADRILRRLLDYRPDATMIFISHRPEIQSFCTTLRL